MTATLTAGTSTTSSRPSSCPRAADFRPLQTLTTSRELYALPVGSVVANGSQLPVFWLRARGNAGRWHESTPTGDQLPADGTLVPDDGLPSRMLALPAVVVRVGDGVAQ